MKVIIYISLFLLPAFVPRQEKLVFEGQVTAADSHDPLVDCHVYVSCKHFGTITDEEGNFYLEIPTCCMTQCIIVSHVGFEKYIAPAHDIPAKEMEIQLEPGVTTLAELLITPDYYRVILQPEFEPYRRDKKDAFSMAEPIIQASYHDKSQQVHEKY